MVGVGECRGVIMVDEEIEEEEVVGEVPGGEEGGEAESLTCAMVSYVLRSSWT